MKTRGVLARKLYQLPAARERYARTAKRLLDEVWTESELVAETERLESMLAPHVNSEQRWFRGELQAMRRFILNRREEVMAEQQPYLKSAE